MESDVEIPRGLIRSWKMWVAVAVALAAGIGSGWFEGRSRARVVEKEVRVETLPPAVCLDVILPVDENKPITCPHPGHHGTIEKHDFTGGCEAPKDHLRCACPQSTIEYADAGAK